jgi:RNA polymerase sigma-70 factor (ECF subfamily)
VEDVERVVSEFTPRAYAVGLRLTGNPQEAWDLTQNAMLKVLKNHEQFDPAYSVEQWLYQIIRHLYIDRLRQEGRRKESSLDAEPRDEGLSLAETLAGSDAEPSAELARRESADAVQAALARLPLEQRMAVALVDLEGYSYEQAAEILDMPASTLGVYVFRGRKSLREKLKSWEGS